MPTQLSYLRGRQRMFVYRIDIRPSREQGLDHLRIAADRGPMQRRRTVAIARMRVCTGRQEERDDLMRTLFRCDVEGCPPELVGLTEYRPVANELPAFRDVTAIYNGKDVRPTKHPMPKAWLERVRPHVLPVPAALLAAVYVQDVAPRYIGGAYFCGYFFVMS